LNLSLISFLLSNDETKRNEKRQENTKLKTFFPPSHFLDMQEIEQEEA
jgi:hypothetical protein